MKQRIDLESAADAETFGALAVRAGPKHRGGPHRQLPKAMVETYAAQEPGFTSHPRRNRMRSAKS
jgi:hypothetical protein